VAAKASDLFREYIQNQYETVDRSLSKGDYQNGDRQLQADR